MVLKTWPLIQSFFRERNFASMEINSFNQFVDKKLPEIIHENNEVTPKIEEVRVEFDKIAVFKPRIVEADGSPRQRFLPAEARLRNRTYSSPIYLTMKLLRRDVEQDRKETYIGELPVMLKANLCWLNGKTAEELIEMGEDPMDFGGYFIINGSEKALMTQEVLASDRVIRLPIGSDRDAVIEHFLSGRLGADKVLVGPGLHEGIDGLITTWQAIVKAPVPYIGDVRVKAILERNEAMGRKWLNWKTAQTFVQMCGRVCRSKEDKGVTYVYDSSCMEILNGPMCPRYLREAMQ